MRNPIIKSLIILLVAFAGGRAAFCEETVENTLITSNHLEMQGTGDKNFFYFAGNVEVQGTNLQILCEELTVVSLREGPDTAAIGSIGAIEKIVASGAVEIHQAGRSAYCAIAEVDPAAGTVVLSGNPRVLDGEVEVTGYQFVLHKGDRRFESIPDPDAPAGQPSRSVVRLGAMPDLGFDQEEAAVSVDDRIAGEPVPEQPAPDEPAPDGQPPTGDPDGNP